MKKLVIIIVLLGILFCNNKNKDSGTSSLEVEDRGVFISYIELSKYVKNSDYSISQANISKIISNVSKMKFNTIILQVRIASDAIYKSSLFPMSSYVSSQEGGDYYDVLDYFIKECHKKNIKLIAWINPYRVRTVSDVSSISKDNPAYKYLNTDTIYINNGIYYNPSKEEVLDLIVQGVREVLNYDIDGLLFDDYFYPDNKIDEKDYLEYIENNDYIDSKTYRLNVVSRMIKRVHSECSKKKVLFGVSPDGNILNNYNKNYVDVYKWLSEDGYVDFIMPQVYYGFYNSVRAYTEVIKEWEEIVKNPKIDLHIALAFYKVGSIDKFARDGQNEWINNDNIIMREIVLSRNLKNYKGFSLFRYDNIFDVDSYTDTSIREIENMKKILK